MKQTYYEIVHYQYEWHPESTNLITLQQLADLACVHPELVHLMVEWSLVDPARTDPELLFQETAVPRIWRIMRLKNDLGINWNGIGVILNLLERIDHLEREIRSLKREDK